jgi:phospholipase D1/2
MDYRVDGVLTLVRSISATKEGEVIKNQIAGALVRRIIRAANEHRKFKVRLLVFALLLFCSSVASDLRLHHSSCAAFTTLIRPLQVIVCIPEVPGFAGDIKAETSIKTIMAAQYRTMNRGGNSIYEEVRKAGFDPCVCLRC